MSDQETAEPPVDVVSRVYKRVQAAQFRGDEYVEITGDEFAHFKSLAVYRANPKNWPQWAKDYRFVPPEGTDGLIYGFPLKVVEQLGGTL